ncbi:MAG: hypothetical protein ACM359_04730 [Bacillota bacterium]
MPRSLPLLPLIVIAGMLPACWLRAQQPSAASLLDHYAESLKVCESFAIAFDSATATQGIVKGVNYDNTSYASIELRFDGQRLKLIRKTWGYINSAFPNIPKERPLYTSYLWDGKKYYQYGENAKPSIPPRLFLDLNKDKTKAAADVSGLSNQNYIIPFHRGTRLMDLLRKAEQISVRPAMERVNGSACFVLDAKSGNVQITLWLDPEHGYNLAKADSTEQGIGGNPKNTMHSTRDKVRFEKIDGVWIPAEIELVDRLNAFGNSTTTIAHYKATSFLHKPDHDALGSFLPSDIANGTLVQIIGLHNINYRWRDGELIPMIDRASLANIDAEVNRLQGQDQSSLSASLAASGQSANASSNTPKPTTRPALLDAQGPLMKFRTTRQHLRAFIATAEDVIDTSHASAPPVRTRINSEIRTDGDRLSLRWRIWNEKDGIAKAQYKSSLWDGQQWVEYRPSVDPADSEVNVDTRDEFKKVRLAHDYYGAAFLGICAGDYEPVDEVLANTEILSWQERLENVQESPCHFIEAKTSRGTYKLWIDPKHGYNLAQVEVVRNKQDLAYAGQRLTSRMAFSMKNVRFEQINQTWVPMEADLQYTTDQLAKTVAWHHRRTRFILAPDFEALRSFAPDDVPNNISARRVGASATSKWQWQNGKVVPAPANQ